MTPTPADLAGYLDHGFDAVIDVRSPSEFAEDHLPGAWNLPVLDDDERTRVGTLYKQVSPFEARKVGGALVAKNTGAHIERHLQGYDGAWRPLVHCWRGGMRSGAFATVLKAVGWRADTLEGGYKAYRGAVVRALYDDAFPAPVILLAGNTGTAKTAILNRLPEHGVQILDLEGLANHRGSLFGWQGSQPSQKMFETRLGERVARLDPDRAVVIEAESSKVGERSVPVSVWKAMKAAPSLVVTAPVEERAAFTIRAYEDIVDDPARLRRLIEKLRPYQAADQIEGWHALAARGDYRTLAAGLMADHYDPRYAKQRARDEAVMAQVALTDLSEAGIAATAATIAGTLRAHGQPI